jgi:hypothetical protein
MNEYLERANEGAMMFASEEEDRADRKLFVQNLGWLLSQTRDGVTGCYLGLHGDDDIVTVCYRGGYTREVNVKADSYAAIIRDVARAFQ